jgi:metallo-beta-lactamase class B
MKWNLQNLLLSVAVTVIAVGQEVAKPISQWPKPAAFPNEDKAAALEHFRKAREYAVGDLFTDFTLRCITDPKYRPRVNAEQYDGLLAPTKVFDNLFYVGQMSVGAWALKTNSGIVLFDALNNETEAREIIVPGLTTFGLDPKDVKWVIVTHSHADHYGGAPYFQKTYGAKVISSDLDWKVMEVPATRPNAAPAPKRDMTITDDGEKMTFGDTEVTFYITPGHTVGTLSSIFPVTDRGQRHLVGFLGGVGLPRTVETKRAQIASLVRWRSITKAAGVDAQIGNHPLNDEGLERMEQLLYRRPQDPNPFVLGKEMYQNYLGVQEECVRFSLARDGLRQ